MEFKDLKRIRGMHRMAERKESEIQRLAAKAVSTVSSLTGMPRAPGCHDKVGDGASAIADEKAALRKLRMRLEEFKEYTENIDDADVQSAVEQYVYERRTWQSIGMRLCYSESGIRKKVKKYLERDAG